MVRQIKFKKILALGPANNATCKSLFESCVTFNYGDNEMLPIENIKNIKSLYRNTGNFFLSYVSRKGTDANS